MTDLLQFLARSMSFVRVDVMPESEEKSKIWLARSQTMRVLREADDEVL
jgi:hypothetical protein